MRDEKFSLFIDNFGEATSREPVPASSFSKWQGVLPPVLLEYWRDEGWASYANGRIWIVNPDNFAHIKDAWLEGTPLENFDNYHVFARGAFGQLYLCGERTGPGVTIIPLYNEILALKSRLKPKSLSEQGRSVSSLFGISDPDDYDCEDTSGKPLFDRSAKKYGPLAADEMYGFEPALVLGGSPTLKNLRRLKLDPHLLILRGFDAPTLPFSNVDIEGLMK